MTFTTILIGIELTRLQSHGKCLAPSARRDYVVERPPKTSSKVSGYIELLFENATLSVLIRLVLI